MSIVERALQKVQRQGAQPEPVTGLTSDPALPQAQPSVAGDVSAQGVREARAVAAHRMMKLNFDVLRTKGLLPPVTEERRMSADFRRLKRPLVARALRQAEGEPAARVIMVASAVPGDGKTFTAFNLALSLSLEKDASVLLIDADLPKPHISTVLGIDDERGLLDALSGSVLDVESLVFQTDRPNLQVLGAGTKSETATELLASQRMHDLVLELTGNDPRRIVVFDSPPLLLTTESRELATIADQIVLVVRAGVTPRQAVLDAVATLGEDKQIGLLLNQVDSTAGDTSYYGYGQYGTYGDAAHRNS